MPSAFSWPMSVPSSLRLPAPVNQGVRAHRVNRIVVVASISVAIFCLAVFSGWSHYQSQPEGDLFYTPISRCDPRIHSFATGYGLTLIAAGLVLLAIAGTAMLATLVSRLRKESTRLKRVAGTSISISLVLFAAVFLSPFFEAKLPLHVQPECLQNAP